MFMNEMIESVLRTRPTLWRQQTELVHSTPRSVSQSEEENTSGIRLLSKVQRQIRQRFSSHWPQSHQFPPWHPTSVSKRTSRISMWRYKDVLAVQGSATPTWSPALFVVGRRQYDTTPFPLLNDKSSVRRCLKHGLRKCWTQRHCWRLQTHVLERRCWLHSWLFLRRWRAVLC